MEAMDTKAMREKKSSDLHARLTELSEQSFRTRCTVDRLTPQKGNELRKMRREVARLKTVLHERELAGKK
jgi:ribosomal protein L29